MKTQNGINFNLEWELFLAGNGIDNFENKKRKAEALRWNLMDRFPLRLNPYYKIILSQNRSLVKGKD